MSMVVTVLLDLRVTPGSKLQYVSVRLFQRVNFPSEV